MDKIRLYQILSVLTAPYREEEFLKRDLDVIAAVRYNFAQVKKRRNMTVAQQKKCEGRYYKSEKELERFLRAHRDWAIRNLDDFKLLLNLFFPEEKISSMFLKDKEMEDNIYCIDNFYLENIYAVAASLLTFRDGRMAIRTWINDDDESDIFKYPTVFDKVEIWNLLGRMMVTDIFIAAFFVEINVTELYYLDGQTNGIFLADKTLEKILQKGLAETHMHFNAGGDFMYLWQEEMNLKKWEKCLVSEEEYSRYVKRHKVNFVQSVYRILWAEYLEQDACESFQKFIGQEYFSDHRVINRLFNGMLSGNVQSYSPEWKDLNDMLMVKWKITDDREEMLFATVYNKLKGINTFSEIIMLFRSLLYFKNKENSEEELYMFLQYLRLKNIYYRDIVQQNQIQGLINFRQYFGMMSGRFSVFSHIEKRYEVIFKSVAHNVYLRKLEVRVSPNVKLYNDFKFYDYENVRKEIEKNYLVQVEKILGTYRNYLFQIAGVSEEKSWDENYYGKYLDQMYENMKTGLPSIGIIFHFIKTDYVDNRIGDMCWVQKKKEGNLQSRHLLIWREALVKCGRILEELRSRIPYLGEYVVGIDAASEENKTEPWIFAPLYAGIRNRKITKPLLKDDHGNIMKLNNLGFTYHVGEEYRHLLSGLRHIDEVIEKFHYKAGDRIGHAIALGTDVEQWTAQNEVVVIPVMEHLENLLWLWGKIIHRNWIVEVGTATLEGRILELAKMVYGNITGLTVNMLYEAYDQKFCYNYEKHFERMRKYVLDNVDPDDCEADQQGHFCKFFDTAYPYGFSWTSEKVFCTYFCPVFYQKFMKPILVHVNSEEKEIFARVQEYLILKVEKMGIYVETNPTSNLAIGDTRSLYSAHVLNLNSRDLVDDDKVKHEVLVTVNSDDPVIFNTNSENELAYVYHALTYQGYKKESILRWVDKVRKTGMDSSFVKKEKYPSQQIREITALLNGIEAYIGKNS